MGGAAVPATPMLGPRQVQTVAVCDPVLCLMEFYGFGPCQLLGVFPGLGNGDSRWEA